MQNISSPKPVGATTPDKERARAQYQQLRRDLVAHYSAAEPDAATIDSIMDQLLAAQMKFKATFGLRGNNPTE
ncbi:hypothetical protein [Rhodoferax sp.]|uniref:hypothetical protein n=1 Tax=Rhodoferax sp. TaxID=50421 RepID=UPI0027663C2F|nr:hypothetical protein [Rhodoferax sp.]